MGLEQPNRAAGAIAQIMARIQQLENMNAELRNVMKGVADSPKYIDTIPGRRVPFIEAIDIVLAANSTTRVEGQFTVSQDGPFVIVAIGVLFKRTAGAYQVWGPGGTGQARMSTGSTGMQFGYGGLYDQPNLISGEIELSDSGSGRLLQGRPVASAVFTSQEGPLPLSTEFLVMPNSVIKCAFTPNLAHAVAGQLQVDFIGYKIVQGPNWQP